MNTAQWPQERVVKSMEEIVPKARNEQALNCPRCNSTNTKFCYYNNYSLSQPRHFCKACKRYWTAGGSLRNIPVGGCSRKNKRSSSSSSTTTTTRPSSSSASASFSSSLKNKLPDLVQVLPPPSTHHQNPKFIHEISQDLNLSFPPTHEFKTLSELIQVPNFDIMSNKNSYMSSSHHHHHHHQHQQPSALELLSGVSSSREGLNPFMQSMDPSFINYSSGFNNSLQEFKPNLSFSLDGFGSSSGTSTVYGSTLHGVQETSSASGRHLFQFKDHLKQVSNTSTGHGGDQHSNNNIRDHSNGYWNGMLGGGGGGGGGGSGSWI